MTVAGWPSPYSRFTSQDEEDLKEWSFLGSYHKYHKELVALAKQVFCIVEHTLRSQPTEAHFYAIYWVTLMEADLYRKKIAEGKLHLSPLAYEYYAKLLARYIIYVDGEKISTSQCY